MKRLLLPHLNPAGLTAAGMAVYAAALMIVNAAHHHGVIVTPVIVAAVGAVAALFTRMKVTPVADPRDGNGKPLIAALGPPGTGLAAIYNVGVAPPPPVLPVPPEGGVTP